MNIKLLKKKDFFLLIFGNLVSRIGTYAQDFALSLYVLKITGSGMKFASVLAITLIPQLIFGPFMGVIADRFYRKKIIVTLDFLSGIVIGITAVVFKLNGGLSLPYIYALVIVLSMISLLFSPTIGAIVPSIMKKEELLDANAISSLVGNIAMVISPMIGGFLFGIYGLFVILIINSISFILSAVSETFINVPKNQKVNSESSVKSYLDDLKEGIIFTSKQKNILAIMFIALIANFALNPLCNIGFPYIIKKLFKCSDFQYGLFQGIMVIGMFIAPFLCTSVLKNIPFKKIITLNMAIIGVVVGVGAVIVSPLYLNLFKTSFVPYITLLLIVVLMGVLISIINIFIGTIFQKEVPIPMMGRVGSVMNTLCMAMTPIGQIIFGFLFDVSPAYIVVAIASLVLVLSSLIYKGLAYSKIENDITKNLSESELAASSAVPPSQE